MGRTRGATSRPQPARQLSLHSASVFSFSAAGIGLALTTSTQTCLAAARAPARLPLAAFAQIPSSLLFVVPGSVGSRAMIDLQMSAYSAAPAAPTAAAVGRLGVEALVAVEVDDFAAVVGVVGVVVAAALEVFAGVVVAVELVVPEPLLLPHPAISAPQSSAAASDENRPTDIASPLWLWSAWPGLVVAGRWRLGTRLSGGTDARPHSAMLITTAAGRWISWRSRRS